MDLNGVSAVVSGGASGLGEASARELAAHGAKVVIADLNEERGKALADELGGVFVKTDVSDDAQVPAAAPAAVDPGAPLRGIMDTPISGTGEAAEAFKATLSKPVPFPKRMGKASEFAHLVRSLIENDYMNAETVRFDGGIRFQPK